MFSGFPRSEKTAWVSTSRTLGDGTTRTVALGDEDGGLGAPLVLGVEVGLAVAQLLVV